jgi:hypothetical protein
MQSIGHLPSLGLEVMPVGKRMKPTDPTILSSEEKRQEKVGETRRRGEENLTKWHHALMYIFVSGPVSTKRSFILNYVKRGLTRDLKIW